MSIDCSQNIIYSHLSKTADGGTATPAGPVVSGGKVDIWSSLEHFMFSQTSIKEMQQADNLMSFTPMGSDKKQGNVPSMGSARHPEDGTFQSPLTETSLGSPSEDRDFDISPLLPVENDFYPGEAHRHIADEPLFHSLEEVLHPATQLATNTTSAATAPNDTNQPPWEELKFHDFFRDASELVDDNSTKENAQGPASQPDSQMVNAAGTFAAPNDIQHPSAALRHPVLEEIKRMSLCGSVNCSQSSQQTESGPILSQDSEVSTVENSQASPATHAHDSTALKQIAQDLLLKYAVTGHERGTAGLIEAMGIAEIPLDDHIVEHAMTSSSNPSTIAGRSSKTRSSTQLGSKQTALGTQPTGRQWHVCDVCQKGFDRLYNMKAHRIIHEKNREQPYSCPFSHCGKPFARKADCVRHTKSVHLRRGEKLREGMILVVEKDDG